MITANAVCVSRRASIIATAAALTFSAACGEKRPQYTGPYGRQVSEAIPKIETAVGLKFKTPPRVESRSKAQVRAFVTRQLTEPRAQREFAGISLAYKRLGMIPDTLDLRKFLTDLLEEQIVGYYDPQSKVLYVVEGSAPEAVAITVTHELVHALQDQYISLDSTQKVEGQNDRTSAAQAVFEGQAVYEQLNAMLGGANVAINLPGGWDRVRDMIRENQSSMPIFAAAPLVIQETLIFPYLTGAEFVRNFKERNGEQSIYADMPVSTEQILHPARYFGRRDAPTAVTLPPLTGATATYENTLGEFETRLFLFQHLRDQNEAVRGAAGWDGDRYALFNIGGGEGIAWVTVWDSPVEASEFRDLVQEAVKKRYHAATTATAGSESSVFTGSGRTVEIRATDVGGRPVVLYVDVPQGLSTNVLDLTKVKLNEAQK